MNLITNASEAIGEAPGAITLSTGVARLRRGRPGPQPAGREAAAGPLRLRRGGRHRLRHGRGDPAAHLRPVLHHQVHRPRAGPGRRCSGSCAATAGALFVDSAPGRGTHDPRAVPAGGRAGGRRAPPSPAARRRGRGGGAAAQGLVLLVDDEEIVRESSGRAARVPGLHRRHGGGRGGGRGGHAPAGGEIDAVLLDLTMPRMDGAAALDRILEIRPGRPRDPVQRLRRARRHGSAWPGGWRGSCAKPYDLDDLRVHGVPGAAAPVS